MNSALKSSLAAMETIAFVLPGPWGPVASAALHMIGDIFNPDDDTAQDQIVIDQIKAGVTEIKTFTAQNGIDLSKSYIADIEKWMDTTSQEADLESNPQTMRRVISEIETLALPTGSIDTALAGLDISLDTQSPGYQDVAEAQIACFVQLRVTVAHCLNYRVVMQNKLVLWLQASDDPKDRATVLTELRNLEDFFNVLAAFLKVNMTAQDNIDDIKARCAKILTSLVNRVGPVTSSGSAPGVFSSGSTITYSCIDASNPPATISKKDNVYHYSTSGGGGSLNFDFYLSKDMAPVVAADRANFIKALQDRNAAFQADCVAVFAKAKDIMADTPADPAPPAQAPTVTLKTSTGWPKAWKYTGKFISYAVGLQGATRSTGLVSPYSDWVAAPASGDICPVVSLSGTSSSGLAIARIVYLRVSDDASGNNPTTIVTAIPNMTDTAFTDLQPVNADDACPNALVAPVMSSFSFNANDPNRTWDKDYRVRYRFKYTAVVNGQATESIDWSPWAVPSTELLGYFTIEADGYTHFNSAYYGPQMLVPRRPGLGCILQRQFKINGVEQPARTIRTSVAPAKNLRMVYLDDGEGP